MQRTVERATEFLARMDAGEFDKDLSDALQTLSYDEIQELLLLLGARETRKTSEIALSDVVDRRRRLALCVRLLLEIPGIRVRVAHPREPRQRTRAPRMAVSRRSAPLGPLRQ